MNSIVSTNPFFTEDLYRKYISSVTVNVLSDEEIKWLDEHGPIRVAYLRDNLAFSDIDSKTGELIGAISEYIKFADACMENKALEFEAVPFDDINQETEALKNGEVDLIFPMNRNLYYGEENGLLFSDIVVTTPMAAVTTQNYFNESADNSVAIVKGNFSLRCYISNNYPNWTPIEYESHEECEKAVKLGKADCFLTSAYRLNSYHNEKSLYYVYLSKGGRMAFAANRGDTVLMSIINKTIHTMPEPLMNGALTMYANPTNKITLVDFVKDNALTALVIVICLIAVFVAFGILYVKKIRKASNEVKEALILAEHANQAKTNFLNNMSHDIRTPMNAIIGFTSLAAAHINDKNLLEDYLKKIMTSSNHLLSLINDVLDMSRIESGRVKIEEKECNLPTFMHDLRNILQADVNAKRLNFLIDTVEVTDEDIICDKLRLNQVLLNCMNNAIKFTMPGGAVGIKIIQKGPSTQDGFVNFEFVVSDTGIGMSEEFAKHIFEPFTREETSTVSGIPGTGLGMAITKNIVDMMGGTISVKSKRGEGTEFTLSFKFRVGENSRKVTTIKNLEGLRALVADDNMDTCASVTRMLETIGMNPEWTMSGKEAVYKAKFAYDGGKPYKAYIIDWLMPDMNGVEVVRRIRREIGDDTPIIILTAYDWAEIEAEARQAGVTAFCAKPLFLSDLYEVLNASVDAEPIKQLDNKKVSGYAGYRVLLVEDNILNREITRSILEELNVQVDEAENGKIAVDMIKNSVPGYYRMVLMDIQMPIMDGYEATRAIRALGTPWASAIPIVAVSANAFDDDIKKSKESGMNEHITKPFRKEQLDEILSKYM